MIQNLYLHFNGKRNRWYAWTTWRDQGPTSWSSNRLEALGLLVEKLFRDGIPVAHEVNIVTDATEL